MELVIYSPKDDEFLTNINFNYDELKQELAVRLEKYCNLVYSEDGIKEARADRATLNKFKNAIEERRKEIKKQCMAPYEEFEKKIKDIVAMIDEPILAIDGQIKEYDRIKKEEKQDAIKQFYTDKVADLKDLVPFDKVFNPRWLNVTYKETDIQKEITDLFIKVEDDMKVITELQSEYELQIKDVYLREFDLTAALQEKKRLEEQSAKMAEYNRQQEERKRQQLKERQAKEQTEPPKTVVIDENHGFENCNPGDRVVFGGNPVTAPEPPKLYTVDFRVLGTADQLNALKQFLVTNNIKYGKVPTEEREAI